MYILMSPKWNLSAEEYSLKFSAKKLASVTLAFTVQWRKGLKSVTVAFTLQWWQKLASVTVAFTVLWWQKPEPVSTLSAVTLLII